jgi:Trm5-related predicted tRNA methylase
VLLTTPGFGVRQNHRQRRVRQIQRSFNMHKGQSKGEDGLTKLVATKVTKSKFTELERLTGQTKGETMSSIVRKILYDRPVKVYTHDESIDIIMEELAANRAEIRSIGININQMAKLFNTYSDIKVKEIYAKNGYERYLLLEPNVEKLLAITEKLAQRWLSE